MLLKHPSPSQVIRSDEYLRMDEFFQNLVTGVLVEALFVEQRQ
jgi:hypothetical protein